jgi:hypothetical protein
MDPALDLDQWIAPRSFAKLPASMKLAGDQVSTRVTDIEKGMSPTSERIDSGLADSAA